MLTTDDFSEAVTLAQILGTLNDKRKTVVASMVRSAQKKAKHKRADKHVWVFGDRAWKPSLVGLVAHKLSDTHNKTVFVWGQGGEEDAVIKGSCRSSSCNVFSLMQNTPDVFVESGGHAQAGGFTLSGGAELILEDALNTSFHPEYSTPTALTVDCECAVGDISAVHSLCEKFSPFGMK